MISLFRSIRAEPLYTKPIRTVMWEGRGRETSPYPDVASTLHSPRPQTPEGPDLSSSWGDHTAGMQTAVPSFSDSTGK